jgi:hypothetical protein
MHTRMYHPYRLIPSVASNDLHRLVLVFEIEPLTETITREKGPHWMPWLVEDSLKK